MKYHIKYHNINSLKNPFSSNLKNNSIIKSIIVPHAGLMYSGIAASSAYESINQNNYNSIIIFSTRHSGKYGILSESENIFTKENNNIFIIDTNNEFEEEHSHNIKDLL